MRLICRCILNNKFVVNCVRKVQVRHFARAITDERRDYILDSRTLTGRILLYLENHKDNSVLKPKWDVEIFDVTKCEKRDIKKCSPEQLIAALRSLEHIPSKYEFLKLLNTLDIECCIRLPTLSTENIFNILQCFMKLLPNRILEYKFYNIAVDKLILEADRLNVDDLVHFIFYIGLQKKSERARSMLRTCMGLLNESNINQLTKEQMCIICNSTFKTSTKIKNKLFLNKVLTYLNDNLSIMKDPALFITLLKTIRHNRFQTDDLMGTISCTVLFNKTFECYSFMAMCHILALYSDYLYYDENILNLFSKRCLEQLQQNGEYRAKDIKKFLWCHINLNYKLSRNDIKDIIVPRIFDRILEGEFKSRHGSSIVEILLYLWMLEYRAYELVPYALTKENIEIIRGSKPNENEKLNMLLYLIKSEDPLLFKKLNINLQPPQHYNMKFQLQKRPALLQVFDTLKERSSEYDIDHFTLSCQVPFVTIIGISGYRNGKKVVNIEVLDEYTCLKNSDEILTGPMALKMKFLDKAEEGLIVINSCEVGTMSEAEIQELLRDEIRLVC